MKKNEKFFDFFKIHTRSAKMFQKQSNHNKSNLFQMNEISHHLTDFIIHNRHQNAVKTYLLIWFDVKFNKQIMSMHRVIYYLHFRQIKSELNQLYHIKLIDFMKQHVVRKHWFKIKNAFYNFRNQTKIFHTSNSKWNNTNDALFF